GFPAGDLTAVSRVLLLVAKHAAAFKRSFSKPLQSLSSLASCFYPLFSCCSSPLAAPLLSWIGASSTSSLVPADSCTPDQCQSLLLSRPRCCCVAAGVVLVL
ncbi:hypothetical protein U1Q18_029579, partial [Sarracenia purpurea var. burkii]